ncbi:MULTISPECIES: PhoX family phosphatase [unclassified Arthrobacter]|uniref:PhoX family protein n=1 Tax=unclassified Arthrobacter TaxID=235627 RepID=UPI0014871177|nr:MULTISPECIES: PhoX family phosphatase [unclassified Arthrobacter]
MLGHVRGKRSAVTCALKCDNACASAVCNTSKNNYLRDIVSAEFSRRNLLGVGALGAAAILLGGPGTQNAAASTLSPAAKVKGGSLPFTPIQPVPYVVDELTVPQGYSWEPLIKWGDPVLKKAPDFNLNAQTPEAQAQQFGYNCDYVDILPLNDKNEKNKRAVLVANHEYTNENIMFPPGTDPKTVRGIAMAAHGMSVVELKRSGEGTPWQSVKNGDLNRRITMHTPFKLTGPAAGSALVRTAADPEGRTVLGTLNNCAGGTTPWGTILSGEENFQGYFKVGTPTAEQRRYGITTTNPGRGWHLDEPRFDATIPGYENEAHRFGYIVELDPMDPTSTPVKHTAMGRFKHEGANVTIAPDGRVVAYMGDDERFDYLYKFVSRDKYVEGNRNHNKTLLANGDLYVARFTGNSEAEINGTGNVPSDGAFDGVGEWLPLTRNGASVIPGMSTEQVLVFTRLAADQAGATKMDRPEDVEPHPVTGKVYVACTNNSDRGRPGREAADEVNPRTQNRDGHIVEITETGNNPTATSFNWNLLMVCGDPAQGDVTYFSGYPADQVSPISCPDNLAFDKAGNLWISTDGAPSGIGYNDGLFKVTLDGAERGKVEQFLSVPRDAETCGPIIKDDEGMVFVAVQHPGEEGAWGAQTSLFPYDGTPAPRPSVVQVFKGKN